MSTKTEELLCDVCGKPEPRIIHVTKSYGKGSSLLVIENVPVISCPACGESYLTAATLREIDMIKRNRGNLATERPVQVAVFA
ncbi:MAG: type II toxin-antitoxin system MqsA family antitoxin [Blastocatellia bacterium]